MSDRTRPLGRYGGPEGAPRIILLRGVYEDTEVTNRRLKWTGAGYEATAEQITFYRKSGTTPITLSEDEETVVVWRPAAGRYEELAASGSADIIYARVNSTGGTSADTNLYNYDSGVSITGCVTASATGQFRNNGQTIDDNQWVILVKRQDTGEYEPEQVGGEATGNVIYAQVNEGSGVTSASGTFAFDNAIAIVGTSPGTGTATNVHSQKYANNEWLLLYQRKSDNAWVTGRRPAAIFTGTAYASFAEGDANLQVENLTAIWGEAPTTTPLTVANTLKLTGATGDTVLVVENDDGNYLAVNNEHRIIEWLKDQSGYDAGETQYFRHVSGTPGWSGLDSPLIFALLISSVDPAAFAGSGTSSTVTPGTVTGSSSGPSGALALTWNIAESKYEVNTGLGDGGYITVRNCELTGLRGSTADPVVICGELVGSGSSAAIHVVPSDLRKLPGFASASAQIPFHDAAENNFQLDGEACA